MRTAMRLPVVVVLCFMLLIEVFPLSETVDAQQPGPPPTQQSLNGPQADGVSIEHVGALGGTVPRTTAVLVDGWTAYVGEPESLVIWDVIDPTKPREWSRMALPASANDIDIADGFLFLALQNGDVQIVDVGMTSAPTPHGTYRAAAEAGEMVRRNATSVEVHGTLAFVTYSIVHNDSYRSEFQIIDVSNPAVPVMLGATSPGAKIAWDVAVVGDTAYVTFAGPDSGGLAIYDVHDPARPVLHGTSQGQPAESVDVVGDRAYVTVAGAGHGDGGLHVIDVSDPQTPTLLGQYASDASGVHVIGSLAYLIGQSGLGIVDVRNPAAMVQRGHLRTSGDATDLFVTGSRVYVAAQGGLHIIDTREPEYPRLQNANITRRVFDVEVAGQTAYLYEEAGAAALAIADINNPARPVLRGLLPVDFVIEDIEVQGSMVYLAAGTDGVQIIDVSDPTAPKVHGSFPTSGYAYAIRVRNGIAYVADGKSGLQIIDVHKPAQPALLSTLDTPGISCTIDIVDQMVYLGDTTYVDDPTTRDGMHSIDVSDPSAPRLRGTYAPLAVRHLRIADGHVYAATNIDGLAILRTSGGAAPQLKGAQPNFAALHVAVAKSLAFVASGTDGVQMIDVSMPSQPAHLDTIATTDYAQAVEIVGDLVLIAEDGAGLQIWRVQPSSPRHTIFLPVTRH